MAQSLSFNFDQPSHATVPSFVIATALESFTRFLSRFAFFAAGTRLLIKQDTFTNGSDMFVCQAHFTSTFARGF